MTKVLITLAIVAVSGCAAPYRIDPVKQAEINRTEIVCKTDRECELKWAAARQWVIDNSGYKIKTLTSDYLETYSPTGGSTYLGARLNKVPMKNGGYRIQTHLWCDNMFGCNPDLADSVLNLARAANNATK